MSGENSFVPPELAAIRRLSRKKLTVDENGIFFLQTIPPSQCSPDAGVILCSSQLGMGWT
ncbi:hypothetical protein P7K49_003058, partial [Saguinus oedipus]